MGNYLSLIDLSLLHKHSDSLTTKTFRVLILNNQTLRLVQSQPTIVQGDITIIIGIARYELRKHLDNPMDPLRKGPLMVSHGAARV